MLPAYVLRNDDFVKFFASNFLFIAHRLFKKLFQPFQTVLVETSEWSSKKLLINISKILKKWCIINKICARLLMLALPCITDACEKFHYLKGCDIS